MGIGMKGWVFFSLCGLLLVCLPPPILPRLGFVDFHDGAIWGICMVVGTVSLYKLWMRLDRMNEHPLPIPKTWKEKFLHWLL